MAATPGRVLDEPALARKIARRVKRFDLIQKLTAWIRLVSKRDWYQNPRTKQCRSVPRHRAIKAFVARGIIKQLSD